MRPCARNLSLITICHAINHAINQNMSQNTQMHRFPIPIQKFPSINISTLSNYHNHKIALNFHGPHKVSLFCHRPICRYFPLYLDSIWIKPNGQLLIGPVPMTSNHIDSHQNYSNGLLLRLINHSVPSTDVHLETLLLSH